MDTDVSCIVLWGSEELTSLRGAAVGSVNADLHHHKAFTLYLGWATIFNTIRFEFGIPNWICN